MSGVVVMELDLFNYKIDKNRTADKVDNFLTNKFVTFRNIAGATASDLSSPLLDPSGVTNHSHTNNQDMAFLSYSEEYKEIEGCQNVVKAVLKAMESCPNGPQHPYGSLLYTKYIKMITATNVYTDMEFSKGSYYTYRKDALVTFAQILPSKMFRYAPEQFNWVPNLIVKSKLNDN